MNRYLIIADDFTGAADTGVQLARRGIPVNVVLQGADVSLAGASCVIDTGTRGMAGEQARVVVREHLQGIDFSRYDCVVKKVDSTLRGNIAEETAAVDEVFHSVLTVLMPAYPDLHRTTADGIQRLRGIRILATEAAKDQGKPVQEDNLVNILRNAYGEDVGHISLEEIVHGRMDFLKHRAYAVDASNNADMQKAVQAAAKTGKKVLWVGSAAIVDSLLDLEYRPAPALALIASVSQITAMQVNFAEHGGVEIVSVDACRLLNGAGAAYPVQLAVDTLMQGQDVMLVSSATCDHAELERTADAGAALGMSRAEVASAIRAMMGALAVKVLSQAKVSGVFLSGGDTAIGFFNEAGAHGAAVTGEVAFGIPLMKLVGGRFDGMRVITKAGAFGQEDAVLYALRKLKEL